MASTSVILGLQAGAPVSYFVQGPDWQGPGISPIVKKISKGLRDALAAQASPQTQGLLYWTPYGNELRGVYSSNGDRNVTTSFRPYANSALQAFEILGEYQIDDPDFQYDELKIKLRDPMGMALSALGLGSVGLGAQTDSYSDLASAVSQGFSFAQKLAPLAGKVGVKAIPYLGWASTILDILGKVLGALEDSNAPDFRPVGNNSTGNIIDVYVLPGETLPAQMSFPPSPVASEVAIDFQSEYGTFPSASRTINHIYDLLSRELYLYVKYGILPEIPPYVKGAWESSHMSRVLQIVHYFQKYFKQFGYFLEFQFDFADWLTVDPGTYDEFAGFFAFVRQYMENLRSVVYRQRSDEPTIFKVSTECCSSELIFPEGGFSANLTFPGLDTYLGDRTHLNLEEAIESSGGCVFPYSIVNGYQIIPTI